MTVRLTASRDAWGEDHFAEVFASELRSLPSGTLPLHRATEQGGMVDESGLQISVLGTELNGDRFDTRAWVFFEEIIGGCNCHDDPPSARLMCTLLVSIDKSDATASFSVLDDV